MTKYGLPRVALAKWGKRVYNRFYRKSMNSIDELTKKILAFRDARDWKQFHKPKDLAISLSLEASEVLEHFQWKTDKEAQEYININKNIIGEELADVLNYLLLISHELGIDLGKACEAKIEKNAKKYPIEKAKGKKQKYNQL
jgi:NTP pyrophosphatase (non-canonical NTP hydrolase)